MVYSQCEEKKRKTPETKLKYTFQNDILFKMLFVKYPDLLKRLVAELLAIPHESIGQFEITNPEIPPETIEDKFCRLDINMTVNGERVDLEIQVSDDGDYPERSLYYWVREYSTALGEGKEYRELPRTIVVSIIAFKLFACKEFHSEYQLLEVTRHSPLTDKQVLHYFELPKLPEVISSEDEQRLWLTLFKADTEEQLKRIEEMEVPIMEEAIKAYRHVTATRQMSSRRSNGFVRERGTTKRPRLVTLGVKPEQRAKRRVGAKAKRKADAKANKSARNAQTKNGKALSRVKMQL